MSIGVLALLVTLAAIPIAYVAASFVVSAIRHRVAKRASARADRLFVRRTAPAFLTVSGALGIVLPAFLIFEPPHQGEEPGVLLLMLAGIGAIQVLWVLTRMLYILHLSGYCTKMWMREAKALPASDWGLCAYAIDAGYPVVAVAGFIRPRLFIDRQVFELCSTPELAAIAAHERAHVRRRDNLRRLVIGACHGPHSTAATTWREVAEQAADEQAADSQARALDLASALLKVARVAPLRSLEATALSTIHDGGSLEARIHYLLALDPTDEPPVTSRFLLAALVAIAVLAAFNWMLLLGSVHTVIEALVRQIR